MNKSDRAPAPTNPARRLSALVFVIAAGVVLVLAGVLSLRAGASGLGTSEIVTALRAGPPPPGANATHVERALYAGFGGNPDAEISPAQRIVWSLRLPRTLVATIAGAALAIAGVLLQGVMRNALAAPNIVGLTSGAGLGATIVMALSPTVVLGWLPFNPSLSLPVAAFIGAVATGLVVYALSWQPGVGASPIRLVLAGVAVTAILTAVTTLIMIATGSAQAITLWMAGSLGAVSWPAVAMAWPYVLGAGVAALALARAMDLLQLGEDSARSLGVRVERTRFGAIALASVLTGAAVSVAGPIGFVGLIVPHLARMATGPRHARLIPASAVAGAALLVTADLGARLLDEEAPVGIVTALLGGPYFLMLLYRTRVLG